MVADVTHPGQGALHAKDDQRGGRDGVDLAFLYPSHVSYVPGTILIY